MTYAQQIGARIAFLRRLKGLTLAELAERVNKHKSTISKYESGQIIIDIESLKEVADALGVDVAQIVEMPNTSRLTSAPIGPHNPFCLASTFYMYYFDGRSARLVSSVICLTSRHDGDNRINASLYMDTPDPQNYLICRYFFLKTRLSTSKSCRLWQYTPSPTRTASGAHLWGCRLSPSAL